MARLENVQIVGGGVGGLAAGLALSRNGVEVEIHEKYGELQGRATGFSVWAYAIKRLMEWGFDRQGLEEFGREIVEHHIHDGHDNELMVVPIQRASEEVGAPSMDVDRRRLQEAIIERIGADRYQFNHEVVNVETDADSAAVVLADGTRASGDLVIGADGIHSVLRDKVLGQSVDIKSTNSDVIEGIAPLEERYLPRGHHKQVWGEKARGGVGWVSDEHVRWFLGGRGVATPDEGPLTKADYLERAAGLPEIIPAAVEATPEDQIVRTNVRHAFPPKRWHNGRVVLLGDSAHTLSAFAGMGACSTIEDVGQLVPLLERHDDPGEAAAAFQSEREGDVTRIEETGRRNERVMMPTNPVFYWLRNQFFSHTPDEKLMEIAERMTGDEV